MSSSIGRLDVELGLNSAVFTQGTDKATYQAEKAAKEIGKSFENLNHELSGMFAQVGGQAGAIFNSIAQAGSEVFESFGKIGSAGGFASFAIGGVGVAAIAAAVGLSELALKGAETIEGLQHISEKTGISIHTLQVFEAAGKTVGVSLEEMVQAMKKFDQGISGVGKNAQATQKVMHSLGITARDNREALLQAADAFKGMQDGPTKAADAVALFGKAGMNMIPWLNKGRDGVLEFEDVVNQFGPKITSQGIAATEAWKMSTEKLSLAYQELTVRLADNFLPLMAKIADTFASVTRGASVMGGVLATVLEHGGNPAAVATYLAGRYAETMPDDRAEKAHKAEQESIDALYDHYKKLYDMRSEKTHAQIKLEETLAQIAKLTADESDTRGVSMKKAAALQAQIPALERVVALEEQYARIKAKIFFDAGAGIWGKPKVEEHHKFSKEDLTPPDIFGKPEGSADTSAVDGRVAQLHEADRLMQDFWHSYGTSAKEGVKQIEATYQEDLSRWHDLLEDKQISQKEYDAISVQLEKNRLNAIHAAQAESDDFNDQAKTFFENWKAQGDHFSKEFFDNMTRGIQDLNAQLVNLMTGGKADFMGAVKNVGKSMLGSLLQTGESKVLGAFGVGDNKPKGTRFDPLYTSDASGLPGGIGGENGLGDIFGSLKDSLGGIFGKIGGFFGGFMADGGDVTPGKAYMVGENHPELFVPGVSGQIVPNIKTSDGAKVVSNLHVSFHGVTDADSFKRSQSQILAHITNAQSQAISRR